MKRKFVIFVILWILYLAQTTVFPMFDFLSAIPNLLIMLTVSIGFMQGREEGVLTGFTGGLLIDLYYGDILGFYALMYLLCGYFCGTFAQIYFDEDVKIPLFLTGACDLICNLIIYASKFLLRGRVHLFEYLKSIILPEMVCTMLFTILLYRVIYKINHSLVEKEKKGRQSLWIRD